MYTFYTLHSLITSTHAVWHWFQNTVPHTISQSTHSLSLMRIIVFFLCASTQSQSESITLQKFICLTSRGFDCTWNTLLPYSLEAIASITVVHVFISQNRDGGGLWLLEASLEAALESTSGLFCTDPTVRLWLLRLWLLVIVSKLALALASPKRSHRRISSLVAGLASGRQILIRGSSTELVIILPGSIQEVSIASTASTSTRWSRSSI